MISILLDTNLLVDEPDFTAIDETKEPVAMFTSSLCLAELLEGEFNDNPILAADSIVQLAKAQLSFDGGIPFGEAELTAYRLVCAAIVKSGRQLTRARRMDMMIAATALANGLTLATRNIDDFAAVKDVVSVIAL